MCNHLLVSSKGAPSPPYFFHDVDNLAEGVQGIPNFTVTHLLFADDLLFTSIDHNELQTMLNKLRVYAQKKSLTVNTQKSEVMCFNSRPGSFLPPLFFMVCSSLTQAPPKTLVWCATDRWIWTMQLTQICDHSWLVLSEAICQEPWPC